MYGSRGPDRTPGSKWDLGTNENFWSDELWALYGLEPHSCEPSYEAWRQTIPDVPHPL